jgi:hypothetical protein
MKNQKSLKSSNPSKLQTSVSFKVKVKTNRHFMFAAVRNGHCIHLANRINPQIFSVESQEPWPTKAVGVPAEPKRSRFGQYRWKCARRQNRQVNKKQPRLQQGDLLQADQKTVVVDSTELNQRPSSETSSVLKDIPSNQMGGHHAGL